MDMKLELVILPVSDVDRAKDFYVKIGFNADHDASPTEGVRFVQLTPPGSACSIAIGKGLTPATPGSVEGLQVVVDDADKTREQLIAAGLEIDPVVDMGWGRFVFFADPDGNKWAVQELPDYAHQNQ